MESIMGMFRIFELKTHKQFEYDFIKNSINVIVTNSIKDQSQNIDTILLVLFVVDGIIRKNKYDINVDDIYKLAASVYQATRFKGSFDFTAAHAIDYTLEIHDLELFEILRHEKQRIIKLLNIE